jgi:hypothetical protein
MLGVFAKMRGRCRQKSAGPRGCGGPAGLIRVAGVSSEFGQPFSVERLWPFGPMPRVYSARARAGRLGIYRGVRGRSPETQVINKEHNTDRIGILDSYVVPLSRFRGCCSPGCAIMLSLRPRIYLYAPHARRESQASLLTYTVASSCALTPAIKSLGAYLVACLVPGTIFGFLTRSAATRKEPE